jgi:uncharacterized protein YoxC
VAEFLRNPALQVTVSKANPLVDVQVEPVGQAIQEVTESLRNPSLQVTVSKVKSLVDVQVEPVGQAVPQVLAAERRNPSLQTTEVRVADPECPAIVAVQDLILFPHAAQTC